MPKPEEISYLTCMFHAEVDVFLLAESVFDLRNTNISITVGRNIGSTLLYYQNERFPPIPAASEFRREFHGERLSLTEAIKMAIEEQWGPFKTMVRDPNQISKSLSIEQIKMDPELLVALQQLTCIKIFSERAFCYYRNDELDKGCLPYFESLEELIGKDKILLFQSLPILEEKENKRRLEENLLKLKSQQVLIEEKKKIIRERIEAERSFNEQMQPLRELLRKKDEELITKTSADESEKIKEEMRRIRLDKMIPLHKERDAKLAELKVRETEINEQLKEAFGLVPPRDHESTSAFPATVVGSSSSSSARAAAAYPSVEKSGARLDLSSRFIGALEGYKSGHQTYQDLEATTPSLTFGAGAKRESVVLMPSIPGLQYQPVPGDGHCLFTAVGLYLGQDQHYLRGIVAANIEHNIEEYRSVINALNPGRTPEEYLQALRQGIEWADNLEIAVLMKMLDQPIVVIGLDGDIRNLSDLVGNGDPIFVQYNGHNHYDAFILTGEKTAKEIFETLKQSSSEEHSSKRAKADPAVSTSSVAASPALQTGGIVEKKTALKRPRPGHGSDEDDN